MTRSERPQDQLIPQVILSMSSKRVLKYAIEYIKDLAELTGDPDGLLEQSIDDLGKLVFMVND